MLNGAHHNTTVRSHRAKLTNRAVVTVLWTRPLRNVYTTIKLPTLPATITTAYRVIRTAVDGSSWARNVEWIFDWWEGHG